MQGSGCTGPYFRKQPAASRNRKGICIYAVITGYRDNGAGNEPGQGKAHITALGCLGNIDVSMIGTDRRLIWIINGRTIVVCIVNSIPILI